MRVAIIPMPEAFLSSIVSRTTGPRDEPIPDQAKLTMFITNSPEFRAKRNVATPTPASSIFEKISAVLSFI